MSTPIEKDMLTWVNSRITFHAMKTDEAISYFGGVANVAELLGLSRQAVYQWGDDVPLHWQYHFERLSAGTLKPDKPLPNYALPKAMAGQ